MGKFKELMRITNPFRIIFLVEKKRFFHIFVTQFVFNHHKLETVRKYIFIRAKCIVRYFIWERPCSLICNLSVGYRPPISFNDGTECSSE